MNTGGVNSGHLQAAKHNITTEYQETDEDREFLDMVDVVDVERSHLDNALEKLEELSFDAFNFCDILPGHGIQYLMFKICQMYNLFNTFHFTPDKLLNFTNEVSILLSVLNVYRLRMDTSMTTLTTIRLILSIHSRVCIT